MHLSRQSRATVMISGRLRAARRHALLPLSGLLLLVPLALPVAAQDAPVETAPGADSIASHMTEAAQRFGIPEHWIRAVMQAESAGDLAAVSSAGAMGLMQVMPDTWTELRTRYGLGSDPFEARDNILAGTAYLREMLDRYGTIGGMLAAYNAGPGRYDEYLSAERELPAETRSYVATLVPMLTGEATASATIAAGPRVSDWREAGLFVPPFGSGTVSALDSGRHGHGATIAVDQPTSTLGPTQSDMLFVVRSLPEAAP